jgi:SIT4-associating protein SAP185/190
MLITDMLRGGNPLTVGVGIVIEVIRKNNSDYDLENQTGPTPKSSDPIYLGTLLRQFASHVPDFMNLINSAGAEKKELKVAFGSRIEPLGFDRFKTCELMAELLHCSNMALLNERGSDSEVKARDAERARLKAEGKLTAMVESSSTHEFGTSVDSAGFHHARAPSFGDSPEEIKRTDVLNNAEDEFENVTASEALVDEMKDDFEEQGPDTLSNDKLAADTTGPEKTVEAIDDEPTSGDDSNEASSPTTPKAANSNNADSPTSADLTEKLGAVGIDEDGVMKELSVIKPNENKTTLTSLSAPGIEDADLSAHPEDKPAPLFSGKPRPKSISEAETIVAEAPSEQGSHDAQTSSPQGDELAAPYEVDVDGSPVVGDFLKMMFVEYHVVPTILVRTRTRISRISSNFK